MRGFVLAIVAASVALAVVPAVGTADERPDTTPVQVHVLRAAGPVAAAALANCQNDGATTGGFSRLGFRVDGPRTAALHIGTVPAAVRGAARAALQASFSVWRFAEPAAPRITVAIGGTGSQPAHNGRYDLMWGPTPSSAIAVTYIWTPPGGAVESDTVFNRRLPWFAAPAEGDGCLEFRNGYDVRNIATHEFGHTYGLGHTGGRFETMYPVGFTGETLKRSLGNGDRRGIRAIY
jgi:hypothetical protein